MPVLPGTLTNGVKQKNKRWSKDIISHSLQNHQVRNEVNYFMIIIFLHSREH